MALYVTFFYRHNQSPPPFLQTEGPQCFGFFPNTAYVLSPLPLLPFIILIAFLWTLPNSKLSSSRTTAGNSNTFQVGTQDGSVHVPSLASCNFPRDPALHGPCGLQELGAHCFLGLHWQLEAPHLLSQGLMFHFLLEMRLEAIYPTSYLPVSSLPHDDWVPNSLVFALLSWYFRSFFPNYYPALAPKKTLHFCSFAGSWCLFLTVSFRIMGNLQILSLNDLKTFCINCFLGPYPVSSR